MQLDPNMIRERHTRRYYEKMKTYYEAVGTRSAADRRQPKFDHDNYSKSESRKAIPDFSTFGDPQGYAGFTPSGLFDIQL